MAITIKLRTGDYLTLNDLYFRKKFKLTLTKKINLNEEEDIDDYVNVYEGLCGKVYHWVTRVGSVFYQEEILAEWRGGYYQLLYNYGSSGYPQPLPKNYEIFLSSIEKEDFEKRVKWFTKEVI